MPISGSFILASFERAQSRQDQILIEDSDDDDSIVFADSRDVSDTSPNLIISDHAKDTRNA